MEEKQVSLRWVSPQDVFNLPLYENYLVIDTRSTEDFSRGSIATAVSYPAPDHTDETEEGRERSLYQFATRYAEEYCRPENADRVVVYGEAVDTAHVQWLAKRLASLQTQRRSVAVYKPDEVTLEESSFDPLEQFCQTVAHKVKEIWLLEGGYQAFQQEYPFLCGNVRPEDMFPVPHQISPGLFMGSRVVPLTRDCLGKMRVTHMILSKHQELDWNQLVGIQVLSCDIHDKNREEMAPCWTASCQFIEEARQQGGQVLVFLHGRSRSASIILAYLMRKHKMKLADAWDTLSKKCWHLIDKSLVYEDQLRIWESTTLYSVTQ